MLSMLLLIVLSRALRSHIVYVFVVVKNKDTMRGVLTEERARVDGGRLFLYPLRVSSKAVEIEKKPTAPPYQERNISAT